MDFDQYLEERYRDQLRWYSRKATANKKWYHGYQVAISCLSAIVSFTVALGLYEGDGVRWYIVSLATSAVLAVLTGFQKLFRFHENWVEYRTTAESLKKEEYYYRFRCGEYSSAASAEETFVERVESFISQQNTLWKAGTLRSVDDDPVGGKSKRSPEVRTPR